MVDPRSGIPMELNYFYNHMIVPRQLALATWKVWLLKPYYLELLSLLFDTNYLRGGRELLSQLEDANNIDHNSH